MPSMSATPRPPCPACGKQHDILESLAPACLDAVPHISDERIRELLAAGQAVKEAQKAMRGPMVGGTLYYRTCT